MRETYDYLTTETEETLDGNAKAAALGLDKSSESVYQIMRCEAHDPFAHFRRFAKGLAKGRVSLREYIQTLELFEQKYVRRGGVRQPGEAIQQQFHEFSHFTEEFMRGISDGSLDLTETDRLLDILAVLEPMVKTSKESLIAHKAKLENAK